MFWDVYANQYGSGRYAHIGEESWVKIHDCGAVHPVRVTEHPEGEYWGWRKTGTSPNELPHMIQLSRTLLSMCFPCGLTNAVKYGQGSVVRVSVEPR